MWAYNISAGTTVIWDAGGENWTTAQLYIYKSDYNTADALTRIGSTTQFYKLYSNSWNGYSGLIFRKDASWSAQTTDITRNISGVILFTYPGNKSGSKLNWQVTENAKKATSGTKIYFDNTDAGWGEVWFKYGTQWYNRHSGSAATKVTGTANLYVITIPNDAYYEKYYLASDYGWTGYNPINDTHVAKRIDYVTSNLASDITYVATGSTSGSSPTVYATTSFSGHTRTLTIAAPSNGSISATYTDESGTEHTVTSGSFTVAQTCKVIITATPSSNYALSSLTLGGNAITSGAEQIIRADGTIAATFVAETTHNVTVSYKFGTRTLHSDNVISVGETTPSSISSESVDGFSFSSWSNLTNVTNKSANLTTDPISVVSTGTGSMTCNYTQWPCSLDIVPSSGSTTYTSRNAMTYDATAKAYKYDLTTTAATQYMRFYINSIEYAPSSNTEVPITGTKVTAETNVTGYSSNKPSVYFNDGGTGSKITVWFDYENRNAWVTEQKYTVTISAGDNGSVSPTSVTAGALTASETITATAADHYHWSSWSLPNSGVTIASGNGTNAITINATASGKTVTANFAGDQYTITYKDQGDVAYSGSNLASLPATHTYGTATALVNGTKTGYTFGGWYTNSACTASAGSSIGATAKTANFTLYAKWTAVNYTASNNIKNSDGTTAGQYNVTYDATSISYTTAPSKTGYSLVGLYKQAAFTNKIVNNDRSIVSSTTDYTASGKWHYTSAPNLYAKWQADTYSITLHDNNGGSHNGTATATYDSNKLTSITAPTRTGYHLVDGYYKESGKTNKISDLSGNLQASTAYTTSGKLWNSTSGQTLYAKWAANTYTIAFNANDDNYVGTATGSTASIAATYGISYTLTTNGFSREGYDFAGWTRNADGTGTSYTDGQTGVSNLTTTNGATVTLYAKWTPKTYTVTLNAREGTCATKNTVVTMGSTYGAGTAGPLPSPTPPSGKVFSGWYTSAGGGTKVESSTLVATPSDHTLYAHYSEKAQVYFKNTFGWSKVYVVYDANWDGSQGTGSEGKTYREMTKVAGTSDVYYDNIPDEYITSWRWNIAFNNTYQYNYHAFTKGEAVFRYDFDRNATMFVPTSNTGTSADGNYTKNGVQYRSTGYPGESSGPKYTSGYWRTYNNTYSGYTMTYQKNGGSWSGGHKMESAKVGDNVFCFTVNMEANSQYNFSFYKNYNLNNKSIQFCYNPSTQINSSNCTNLQLDCNPNNSYMQTTVAGEYTFQLEMKADGHMYLSVIYPLAVGDFRVRYNYTKGSAKTYYSEIIKGRANGKDTISIFIHSKDSASSRSLTVERCTGISSGTPTWNTSYRTVTSKLPAATTAGGKTSGVYDFIITQNGSKEIILDNFSYWKQYTGNYYIRTQCADGGWDLYKYRTDNIMTLSEYSLTQTLSPPYSHYYCRFIGSAGADITYCIATDYSPNISGTMIGDETIGGVGNRTLPATANVRFTWNMETNALRRAYLKNAQNENERFLVLHGRDSKIFNADGSEIAANPSQSLVANELLFSDLGNWVYQVELDAQPFAAVSLIANYNGQDRYLIGGADSYMQIMGGTGSDKYDILAVYDFKTNRLMTVWIPSENITESLQDVDVLLIRHGQDAGRTIVFGTGGALNTNKVIGAIEFHYNELVGHVANWNQASREKLMFDVSFPFDVNVSDIFGLNAAYGEAYAVQKYNGEERASKGFFQGDGTTTFWQTLSPSDVMKANVGYTIITDNDYFNNDVGHLWDNKTAGSKIYLYFPSASDVGNITSETQKITVPEHECTIDRTFTGSNGRTMNHKYTDSNWNMMGVPVFANVTGNASGSTYDPGRVFLTSGAPGEENTFHYFYQWNTRTNGYDITAGNGYQFKSMHSYMVQYTGQVWFTGTAPAPAVAARRIVQEQNYTINMQLLNETEEVVTRTYVELRENACDTFALNEDVCMIPGEGDASIYSFAGNYDVAANVLPIANQVVVLGVEVNKAGKYTFSMPSIFSGKVTLIDNYTGEHVDLSMDDYEVELEKGIISDRFMLEINIEKVTTAIDGTNGKATLKDGKAHKFLQNGILYILQNGILYDAQGKRVQ